MYKRSLFTVCFCSVCFFSFCFFLNVLRIFLVSYVGVVFVRLPPLPSCPHLPKQPASRQKKKVPGKVVPRQDSGRSQSCVATVSNAKIVCAAQPQKKKVAESCVRGPTLKKKGGRKFCARLNLKKRLLALIKKASVGPTQAQQVHRIWASKTLCASRIVRKLLYGTLQQL